MTPPTVPLVPHDQRVTVTDIRMPFMSMVIFMVKWSIAAIPAIIILFFVTGLLAAIVSMLLGGFRRPTF
jgi:hypothetical protein